MSPRHGAAGVLRCGAVAFGAVGAFCTGHLLLLLGAALARRRPSSGQSTRSAVKLAVVIPAHDEQDQIERTLASLDACAYAPGSRRTIVIADNCSDETGVVARRAGAEVWERSDPHRRGKGYALAWAFERLLGDPTLDAACVVDADCEVSPNFLAAVADRIVAGADAVQVAYLIADPEASTGAALRFAGFALFNVVRPAGRDRLGLSCGLLGTGMGFSRGLLARSPWGAFSYAEDREQHLRWVLAGARVRFAAEARVTSASSPPEGRAAQESRWDSGRLALAASLSPRLLRAWVQTGDPAALDAALEPLLPPQSLLAAINVAALVGSGLSGARRSTRLAAAATAGQLLYVLGGLTAARAPKPVWHALLRTPGFLVRRTGVLSRLVAARGPAGWARTPRAPTRADG